MHRTRNLVVLSLLCACAALLTVAAISGPAGAGQDPPQDPPPRDVKHDQHAHQDHGEHAEAHHDEDVLHEAMETINAKVREVFRNAPDTAALNQTLASINELQAAIVSAKGAVPDTADSVDESERATFVLGYRKALSELLMHFCKIDQHLMAGETDAAVELLREIPAMRDAAHEIYREDH
ncbi:MAG: cytochrome b562 [Phycisphaerales bacterium]